VRHLAFVAVLAALATPVWAQTDALPPEVDKLLWCASAFYWLAGSAEDSGDQAEAELYDGWSQQLLNRVGVSLTARAYAPERIEALIADYDERVLAELGSPTASHDITTCPAVLEE
jgi:hypothetical protein